MVHTPRNVCHSFIFRFLSVLVLTTFLSTTILSPGYAQSIGLTLPLPGTMMNAGAEFSPVLFKGLTVHPENPLQFDFMVDSGTKGLKAEVIKKESERLAKYFLAAMTVPQDELWVNLSPFEENRIIPDELGKTELGRDMLAQDYLLKQLTASLMYPEKELGKKFWDTVRARAKKEYGVEEIPTDMFNKVWIVPDKAVVYEYGQTVYVVEGRLKVMLEEDYAASRPNLRTPEPQGTSAPERVLTGEPGNTSASLSASRGTGELTKEIMRELIIPELEREVNQGAHFAPLRQIFHALILAKWYKEAVKESLLSQIYVDRHKILGVENADPGVRDQIYARYLEAYQK
ncbi:MAG TPA: hypothetical protein VLJ10_06255, partial [Candidatus Bathyarchaeia archaeon]|nr:hypothetical protein [Candidatus Bathyarchaeia archaeon]